MLNDLLNIIPVNILNFILTVIFSLLIGLEQRSQHKKEKFESLFGTDRTFTLIGILGYILYIIEPNGLTFFAGGGIAITAILITSYWGKIKIHFTFGITSIVIALITYCLAPLIYLEPAWLVILIVVTVLWLTEQKAVFFDISKKFDNQEFVTLAKFLVIVGVVLPLLPDSQISEDINISPYKFWLAIVAVSGISYISYLLKKFVFPKAGILLTAILGGLYSSTATTIILAKQSKDKVGDFQIAPAILLATTMMYVRILLLAYFFNKDFTLKLAPSFAVFIIVSVLIALYYLKIRKPTIKKDEKLQIIKPTKNPLEFKTALVFALLFIFFALVTEFVTKNYGEGGIKALSFLVGVTDIDPFIINLFQSKWNINEATLIAAIIIATSSNNLLKMVYGIILCNKSIRWQLIIGFGILVIIGLLFAFF